MEADSYTLHFQIYVSGVTSAADPTARKRTKEKERKKEKERTKEKERKKRERKRKKEKTEIQIIQKLT